VPEQGDKKNNLQYARDTTLLVESKKDVVKLIKSIKNKSERAGVKLNLKKTRVMSTWEQGNIFVDSEEIRTVTGYKLLGALTTNDGYTKDETERKNNLGQSSNGKIDKNHGRLDSLYQHKS
jgi:hypothetical protein